MSVRFRHFGFKQNSILATLNEDVCENYWGGALCDRKGVASPSGEVARIRTIADKYRIYAHKTGVSGASNLANRAI
jgi:hypothetical protein